MIGYQAPAVQKAFQVLNAVAEAPEGMGLCKISEHLGFSKGTTHGLVQALLKVGALDQSPYKKKLFLGSSLADLAAKTRHYYGIAEQAQPLLDALGRKIDEAVFLGVINREKGTIIAVSQATRPLGISSTPGTTVPLMSGAVGKAFLASLKKNNAEKIVRRKGLRPFTGKTIIDENEYMSELEKVRKNGYALDDEEYLSGVKAVAINVGNRRGLPMVIWVAGLAASMGEATIDRIVGCMKETADLLQRMQLNRSEEVQG